MQLQQAYLSCHVPVRLCLLRLAALLRGRRNLMSDRRSPLHRYAVILTLCILQSTALFAQTPIPNWCRKLPRPEYKTVERVSISDPWFEVYKPAQGVFAIYEPHQAEETSAT